MEVYNQQIEQLKTESKSLKRQNNAISFFRLLCVLLFLIVVYFYYQKSSSVFFVVAFMVAAIFILLVKQHDKQRYLLKVNEALIKINKDEISYLNSLSIPFDDGVEFTEFSHMYCFDLDIFGKNSLFQNLNRTSTYIGKKTLAHQLLNILPNAAIVGNQIAIGELAPKFLWRQQFMAVSKVTQDSKDFYETLMKWSARSSKPLSKFYEIISIISPLILIGCAITFGITKNTVFLNYIPLLFLFNLFIIRNFLKQIKAEINDAENIDKIIKQYSLILQKVENQEFKASKLLFLQQKLHFSNKKASQHLKKLSFLFSQMDIFFNAFATILFNGLFLFHLHVLKRLADWKKDNASELQSWLEVIGEFEMLNSLANLSYNNLDFAYPKLNSNFEISFANISHPLLNLQNRVTNHVTFQPQSFTILTGSNMSGKSTFLRSLGINMVLAGIGSVVCASSANIHPLPILVSMRLSDSLADNESYFYAEIKRLKQIMNCLEKERSFVLLDEILRGTNSDDKRNGTVEVIKKMIDRKAIGAIATHDIEVCLTTTMYPQQLVNKCFEAQIVNDDLYFDFKLRDGICKNRSASFLMQKMGVI